MLDEDQDIIGEEIANIYFQPSLVENTSNKALADRQSKQLVDRQSMNLEKRLEQGRGREVSSRKVRLTT